MLSSILLAQATDTTIYKVADEMPRFPGCEALYDSIAERQNCASQKMLEFIYRNIRYPDEARQQNIEGNVVVQFVVEKDGSLSQMVVLREIGGGCGQAAIEVLSAMSQRGLRWIPGKKNGQPVRVQFNLPVRFKLQDPVDYTLLGRDTVWTKFDTTPVFKGGEVALQDFLAKNLSYPAAFQDSCLTGNLDISLLVRPDGSTRVLDVANYSNLGFEFVVEAIHTAHQTWKRWEPATLGGRQVTTLADLRTTFKPIAQKCQTRLSNFENAQQLLEEAVKLFNDGKTQEGYAKINAAIGLTPEDAQLRYIRGQAYMAEQKYAEACQDYRYVRQVLNIADIDKLTLLLCGKY
jgi:TonB family protein